MSEVIMNMADNKLSHLINFNIIKIGYLFNIYNNQF